MSFDHEEIDAALTLLLGEIEQVVDHGVLADAREYLDAGEYGLAADALFTILDRHAHPGMSLDLSAPRIAEEYVNRDGDMRKGLAGAVINRFEETSRIAP
jgi:hypothetical protein